MGGKPGGETLLLHSYYTSTGKTEAGKSTLALASKKEVIGE